MPRELLLVEVERYCRDPDCYGLTRIGLTKTDAREYGNFTCARCEQTWDDSLRERDIPEWWEELKITSLEGVRALEAGESAGEDPGEVVARMSDAWRAGRDGAGSAGEDET